MPSSRLRFLPSSTSIVGSIIASLLLPLTGAVLLAASTIYGCAHSPVQRGRNLDAMDPSVSSPGRGILSLRWRIPMTREELQAGPQEFASAALSDRPTANSKIFIGSQAGEFYAISGGDGEILWKRKLASVSSKPLVNNGSIYVGTDDGTFYCLENLDGKVRWEYETRGAILQPPVVVGDLVIFSNETDQVFALDRHRGTFRWQHKVETPEVFTLRGHGGVAASGELVFAGFADGRIVALRAASGTVAWVKSISGEKERFVDVDSTPIILDDTLFVTSSAGGVYALDKNTGAQQWRVPMDGAGPIFAEGLDGANAAGALDGTSKKRLYVGAAEYGISALDLSGNIIWRQGTHNGGEPTDLAVTRDYLLYALGDAGLFVANKHTGVVYQYFDPGFGFSGAPVVDQGLVFILSNAGYMYGLYIEGEGDIVASSLR